MEVEAAAVLAAAALQEDGKMKISRLFKHLLYPPWLVRRKFPPASLKKIEKAIQHSETRHSAEIRFAVESSLSFVELVQDISCFDRGVDVFSELRVWDTEQNNGVLIYLLLADRTIEIIADRDINKKVDSKEWLRICRLMESFFRKKQFETGVLKGIEEITRLLITLYPANAENINELPNKPVIL